MSPKPLLIVVTGPTGSGKTSLAIELARRLKCHIIGADSRQLYKGMPIGTASPTAEELAQAPHHLVGVLEPEQPCSAAGYEEEVLKLLPELFKAGNGRAILCGGSMMYIDAVCNGLDDLPTVRDDIRREVLDIYDQGGLEALYAALRVYDPEYLRSCADLKNYRRLAHALEISIQAGRPYSAMRTGRMADRPFDVVKMYIDRPREELFRRINVRVEKMMAEGLLDEATRLYGLRVLNSLNTVGYKELFAYMDGVMTLPEAVARIGKNTRVYAKKQLTWLKRAGDAHPLDPDRALEQALALIDPAGV